jgi:2-iminobutanoate/2-iminopropanoate deaminase
VAGGLVFVSGVRGTDDQGRLAGPDLASQTRRALDRLRATLGAAGSSMAQAVTVHVYLKQASDFAAMNAIYAQAFPSSQPTRTTIVAELTDGALVELSAVAVPTGALRETLHPKGWVTSPRPYSYIVRTQDFVFLSGLVSRRGADDQPVGGPMTAQVRTVLDNAATLLETAGVSFKDVVTSRVFITDGAAFQEMNAEYRKSFPTEPPARATVIAGLMGASMVEITLVAARGGRQIAVAGSSTAPLSAAVKAGPFVFLSGVLGNTAANATDAAAQTRETLTRIGRTLQTAGLGFGDVVDNLVYLPRISDRATVDPILREVFPKDPPAETTVGTALVAPTGLVELMMTAISR